MTKIDIFSGFLGAGKTTLIQKLLKEAYKGEQVVLIENEFGEIGIDGGFLKEAGIETKLIEGIEPDPSVETVMKGAEVMREFEPDLIVAMGGGSPIDAAKAMWVFYEHPETTFDDIKDPFTIPELRNKATFIAIPSTSGTATEVTAFSVITDYAAGIKYPLADENGQPSKTEFLEFATTRPETLLGDTAVAVNPAIWAFIVITRAPA